MSTARSSLMRVLVLGGLVGTASSAWGVPIVDNGSMTGPMGAGIQPPGWFAVEGSPDTADATGPFNNTGHLWALSPDGGTFVRAIGPSAGFSESIGQVITGFDVGVTYQVDFFQTNLAFAHPTSGDYFASLGQLEFFLDGVSFATSSAMLPPPTVDDFNVWEAGVVTFTATATSHELAIAGLKVGGGGAAAYMGVDGVGIHEVPAPGVAGLMGLAGLAAVRRRRGA